MAGKIWKKVLLLVLLIACLFDIVIKLVNRNSFKNEIEATAEYFSELKDDTGNQVKNIKNQIVK